VSVQSCVCVCVCVCAQRAREEAAKAAELQYHAVVMERTEREFEVRVQGSSVQYFVSWYEAASASTGRRYRQVPKFRTH
jgi:hypothetical protein